MLGLGMAVVCAGCFGDECDLDAPNTICTIAGSGEQGLSGDGRATAASLYIPMDTAVSPDGEVWVLDFNNYLVRAIGANGSIRTVVGNGMLGDSPPAGVERVPATEALLNHISDLRFDDGYLYLAAWHNSRVKRVRLSDMTLENVAGRGRRTYYDGDGGPALTASLDLPSAIAISPDANLILMDQGNQVIRMIDGSGLISTIAGKCVANSLFDAACAPGAPLVQCPGSSKLTCADPATTCDLPCAPSYEGKSEGRR